MLGTGRLDEVFPGEGTMAALLRAHDWESSGLGHPDDWPQELRAAARLCVTSRFPIVLWWGDDLRLIYNDAYLPALGERKHPAIARPGREVWPEIWHIVGPQLQGVMETGVATWSSDLLLPLDRSGYLEETYWTYSYGPIPLDGGGVGGVFTPCFETTEKIVAARRLRTLNRLADASGARGAEEACALAAEALAQDASDIPFARVFLADPQRPGRARAAAGTPGVPEGVPTGDVAIEDGTPWARARDAGGPVPLPLGGGGRRAVIQRLRSSTQPAPIGYLVAGISPALAYDSSYETFVTLAARQVAASVVSARAAEEERRRVEAVEELGDARRAAAQRARLLADASLRLDGRIGVVERLDAVVSLLVGGIADMVVVYLAGDDGVLRRAAAGHVDPQGLEGLMSLPEASEWMQRLALTGRSELIAEVTDADVREMAADEEELELRRSLAPRSYVGVPIRVRGASLGVVALGRGRGRPAFTEDDRALMEELGRRIGLAVDNARLYERAQEAARVEADRAQELTELQRLTAALSQSLTPAAVADAVMAIGLPLVGGEAGGLMTVDEDGASLRQVHLRGYPRRADRRERTIPLTDESPLAEALRTRALVHAASTEEAVARWPAMTDFARSHGRAGSLAALPLVSGDRPLGALAVRFPRSGPLASDTRRLLETVGRLTAAALLRSSEYQRERSVAETLQRSLLPLRLPEAPGVAVAAGYAAAGEGIEAGGDWYDSIELADGRIALMVGDVVGRGPRAASVMGQLRSALRAFAGDERDGPAEVLANLSRFAERIDGADVATVCYAELDIAARRLRYVCAGHPPPLAVSSTGRTEYLEGGRGVPLGVHSDPAYHEAVASLAPGTTLILYTDGLVERRGVHIDHGFAVFAEAVARHAGRSPRELTDAILGERGGSGDDCALLACRLEAPLTTLDVEVTADPQQLRVLRDALRGWLAALGVGRPESDDLVLAAGEALANAVEHGHGPDGAGAVRLRAGMDPSSGLVEMTVTDDGRWREPPADPGDRGRGFMIMRALMDAVDVDRGDAGTRVTLTRRIRGKALATGAAPPPAPVAPAGPRTLVLDGEIDASEAAARLEPLTREGSPVRTLDLTAVTVLGSAAIQLVFAAARRVARGGERLELVAPEGSLPRRLIGITGLDAVCDVRDDPG